MKKGRTENKSRNLPDTWMPAPHGVGFALSGKSKVPSDQVEGRTENLSRNIPGTWMPAPRGVGFALSGEIKGIHERTYT